MLTENEVLESLLKLGNSKEEVYLALKLRGITGYRGSWDCCPIANFIKKENKDKYPECPVAEVGVTAFSSFISNECKRSRMENTEAVQDFILNFDRGAYPDIGTNFLGAFKNGK